MLKTLKKIFQSTLALSIIMLMINQTQALTSTIKITRSPYLAFNTIPTPFNISNNQSSTVTVPTTDTQLTSNQSSQPLPETNYLTVQDTRGCGGFNLQVSANAFTPAPTAPNTSLNNDFRIITSTNDNITGTNVETDASNPGIKYYGEDDTTFTGTKGIVAPLNITTTNFADPTLFTSAPFNTGSNILTPNTQIDLMQGGLTAPNGRNGLMHLSLSYYITIPKFTIPNTYYSTITYTLTDNTSGSC